MFLSIIIRICFLIGILTQQINSLKGVPSKEYELFNDVFKNHSKSIRPVKEWNDILNVQIKVELKKIATVIENHQTMRIYVRMEICWLDANLGWDPKKYKDIKSLALPADSVWVPDLHLFNSATEDDRIYPQNVELFSNGTIIAYPINNLFAHCDFNFDLFPYDSQSCEFLIGTMLDKVSVQVEAFVERSQMVPNAEWKFLSMTPGETHSFLIPGTNHEQQKAFSYDWHVAKFRIHMKRNSKFYVNLFIWPLVFILFLGSSVFILPPSCVERISTGVFLLLALVIMSLMMDSFTPKSANLSVIGGLIEFNMFMITWAILVSTLIISIDKENFLMVKKIPQWLKNLLLKYIGKIVFKQETLQNLFNNELISTDDDIKLIDTSQILDAQKRAREVPTSSEPQSSSELTSTNPFNEKRANESLDKNEVDLLSSKAMLALINNQVGAFRSKLKQNDLKNMNKQEWYLIATVFDRLFLIIYIVLALFKIFLVFI